MCCSEHDRTALDGFPLYWVEKLKLKKAKTLDELSSADRRVCQVLASLGVIFNIAELIKNEYSPIGLASYIGIGIFSCSSLYSSLFIALLYLLTYTCTDFVILLAYLVLTSSSLVQAWC